MMDRRIAYCGLDCEACDAYLATIRDDQALREKTAALWAALNQVPSCLSTSTAPAAGQTASKPYTASTCVPSAPAPPGGGWRPAEPARSWRRARPWGR